MPAFALEPSKNESRVEARQAAAEAFYITRPKTGSVAGGVCYESRNMVLTGLPLAQNNRERVAGTSAGNVGDASSEHDELIGDLKTTISIQPV